MKAITTTTDFPEGDTVRAKFTVLGDTRTVRRLLPTPPPQEGETPEEAMERMRPVLGDVTETFDNLVAVERIPAATVSARATHWYNVVNNLPIPPSVPVEIANWRARAVLELAGLLDEVTSALYAMEGDAGIVARHAWNSGAALARNGPTVTSLAALLTLTDVQVDAMFIQAANLNV